MSLQHLCEETVAEVEGCLGCAVVDLETGLPLAMEVAKASVVSQDAMELLAAASAEYFRGRMMWQLQLMIAGNDVAANFVQEIQTTTEDTYNFMSAVPGRETTVLVLILDKAANLGLGRISVRQVLRRLSNPDDDVNTSAPAAAPRPAAPVVMPSAFMHAQAPAGAPPAPTHETNPAGEPARPAHVPYRDVSAADELGANDARNADANARPWRGGLGGRTTR